MDVKQHLPGMFSWADLVTTDHEGSKSFYTELLGLDATDMPMGGEGVHTTLSKDGRKSCAIYEMPREMKPMTGGLAGWQSYFTVSSADETAERIRDLGGSLTIEPSDASTSGRMALAQDPDGAHFFIWEPRAPGGPPRSCGGPWPGTSCTPTTRRRLQGSTAASSVGRPTWAPVLTAESTSSSGFAASPPPA